MTKAHGEHAADVMIESNGPFTDRHSWPKLTQEDICDLNGPISSKGSESIMNSFPKQEASGPGGCGGESYQIFVEKIVPILYNILQSRNRGNALQLML